MGDPETFKPLCNEKSCSQQILVRKTNTHTTICSPLPVCSCNVTQDLNKGTRLTHNSAPNEAKNTTPQIKIAAKGWSSAPKYSPVKTTPLIDLHPTNRKFIQTKHMWTHSQIHVHQRRGGKSCFKINNRKTDEKTANTKKHSIEITLNSSIFTLLTQFKTWIGIHTTST